MNKTTITIAVLGIAALTVLAFVYSSSVPNPPSQDETVLATSTSMPQSEYVVDESDMIDGGTLVAGIEKTTLTKQETEGLILMREEEKLARDVYTTLGTKWGTRIFSNIASSEQTHTDAVRVLLERCAIPDPVTSDAVGVFQSPVMQKLYNDLIAQGERSLRDALIVGATVEDLDINDLDKLMKETNKEDILVTYKNLQKGSRNHMRAFVKNLSANSGTYVPQYITQEAYNSIIGGTQERGRI